MAGSKRGFVLLSLPRSGTHLMCDYINSHPDLHCHGELFNVLSHYTKKVKQPHTVANVLEHYSAGKHVGYTHHMTCQYTLDKTAWIETGVADMLKAEPLVSFRPEQVCVVLHRWNLLRRYVSDRMALKCRAWEARTNAPGKFRRDEYDRTTVNIPLGALRTSVDMARAAQSTIGLRFQNAIHITYEQLCSTPKRVMWDIYKFLGVDPGKQLNPTTTSVRFARVPISQQVTNYEELKAQCMGTDMEPYFDE